MGVMTNNEANTIIDVYNAIKDHAFYNHKEVTDIKINENNVDVYMIPKSLSKQIIVNISL
jgi:hypothetical protein